MLLWTIIHYLKSARYLQFGRPEYRFLDFCMPQSFPMLVSTAKTRTYPLSVQACLLRWSVIIAETRLLGSLWLLMRSFWQVIMTHYESPKSDHVLPMLPGHYLYYPEPNPYPNPPVKQIWVTSGYRLLSSPSTNIWVLCKYNIKTMQSCLDISKLTFRACMKYIERPTLYYCLKSDWIFCLGKLLVHVNK